MKRIFIYGSCVSRDALEFATPGDFQLVDYVARSSLCSSFGTLGSASHKSGDNGWRARSGAGCGSGAEADWFSGGGGATC